MSLAEQLDSVDAGTAGTVDRHSTTETFPSTAPATGAVAGVFPVHDTAAVEATVARARTASAQWAVGRPQGHGEVRGWIRRDDATDASPLDLLVFADALPPVTFDLGLYGWVPTLELTVHVRGLAAPGWLRVVQRATVLRDGWLDEECLIWDGAGHLVAQARQLAGYRLPEA